MFIHMSKHFFFYNYILIIKITLKIIKRIIFALYNICFRKKSSLEKYKRIAHIHIYTHTHTHTHNLTIKVNNKNGVILEC